MKIIQGKTEKENIVKAKDNCKKIFNDFMLLLNEAEGVSHIKELPPAEEDFSYAVQFMWKGYINEGESVEMGIIVSFSEKGIINYTTFIRGEEFKSNAYLSKEFYLKFADKKTHKVNGVEVADMVLPYNMKTFEVDNPDNIKPEDRGVVYMWYAEMGDNAKEAFSLVPLFINDVKTRLVSPLTKEISRTAGIPEWK